MKRLALPLLVALALLALPRASAQAQDLSPRFGAGFNAMVSTEDGFGIGARFRGSAPVNRDLSIGIDLGLTGFIFEGRDDASYVADPQISVIVTLPSSTSERLTYFVGGVGAYLPFQDGSTNGNAAPTLHFGIGRVRPLTDTSVFYEVNPAIIIGENSVNLLLPVRVGVIF